MSDRREVDVNRPEHSWIPFYRELAKKLADPAEGWRERQEELMDLMREMALDENLGVPEGVARSEDPFLDPFSLFAAFNNSSRGEKRLLTIQRVGEFFELNSTVLHADFYVPEIYSGQILYFAGVDGYRNDVDKHWDLFEFVFDADPFDDARDMEKLIRLMDFSLNVKNVGMAKLSSAFYWINPYQFLEYKTIEGIVGKDVIKSDDDASTYLEGLARARQIDRRPLPEINIEVYLRDHLTATRPKVWVVRGGRDEDAVDRFVPQNRVGIGFGMGGVNLSVFANRREIANAYREANVDANNRSVGQNVRQIENFILDMKVGDYVIMPVGDQIRYGAITSRPYHDPSVGYENSRKVAWYESPIPREQLSDLPLRRTVSEVKDQLKDEIWAWFRPSTHSKFQMPEDSWVPFHLEVGRRLIEEEMWKPEMREVFGNLVLQVMGAAGVFDSVGVPPWTPDPYSFYLAFNTAIQEQNRDAGYARVQEMFQITVDVPERGHYARQYPVHYWGEMHPEPSGVGKLWDFFRFVREADPVNDPEDAAEFVERFDVTISSEVPGMASATVSQWLYWIDPKKYLLPRRIYWRELGLAKDLGINEPLEGGAKYLAALKAVSEFAKSKGKAILDVNRDSTTREMLGLDGSADTTRETYDVSAMLKEHVFLQETRINRMLRILRSKKNLILQGPPGVGKTFIARKLAYVLMGEKGERAEKRITSVQFHQSYSYEDFVGGFRPDVKDGRMVFTRQDGPFLRMCAEARANPDDDYVMLIDEINRGNLSRVFGELLMLIEADKRTKEFGVTLQHRPSDPEGFFVPENVYIIGTMNLADRSLTGMNVAMRRRFGFVDLKPQFGESVFTDWLDDEIRYARGNEGARK